MTAARTKAKAPAERARKGARKRARALTLADLRPDPQNARRHTPRNVGLIEQALRDVGAARSIVVDEHGMVLAGNATLEAAAAAGIERLQVVDADGQTIVAVRRRGLTPAQKARLALFDNRAAELAEWDMDVLALMQTALPEALAGLWTDTELAALLQAGAPGAAPMLSERFGVPPFSVLDARQGYWQARKAAWLALGIQSELGRGDIPPGGGGGGACFTSAERSVPARYRRGARPAAEPEGAPPPGEVLS